MFRFDQLFKRADAVQRHLAAPLARARLAYLAHRAGQGARPSTLRGIAALQIKIIHYLELGERGEVARPAIEAAARRWVSRDPARRGGNPDLAQRHFVSHATCWLRFAGRLKEPAIATHPHAGAVADFVDWMRQERGWSEATIRGRRARADAFLRRFCTRSGALAEVTVATIDRALRVPHLRTGHPRRRTTIRTHADALRAFFRFAEHRGWSRPGIAAAVEAPRVYRDAALPVGPSRHEQRLLLASTERDHPADLRDRTLLLMLLAYGLRAGEVCALQLDDIDWKAETLRVRRSKTGRTDRFPLSRRVGEALARYLRHTRPPADARTLFLALTAPARPLTTSALSSVVRRRMRRCGITCPRRGAHALRHAFAQRLLDEGFPMQEIGDCLGHRSLDSTAVYAKVALADLRQVADFGLEGLA